MENEDTCCCCLVNCCSIDINQVYNYNGKMECYGAMLSNTFNISVRRKTICVKCVVKLRDAADFKQQILAADQPSITEDQLIEDDQEIFQVALQPEETNTTPPEEDTLENVGSTDSSDDAACIEKNKAKIASKKKRIESENKSLPTTVNKCWVYGCQNRGYHRLPRDPIRRGLWIKAIQLGTQKRYRTIAKTSRICDAHFTADDYSITPSFLKDYHKSPNILKKTSVPSLFCSNPTAEGQPRYIKVKLQDNPKLPDSAENTASYQEAFGFDPKELEATDGRKKTRRALDGLTNNTIHLIENSNLCIFQPHQNNTEYACYLCEETFTDIKEHREHSKTHKLSEFLKKLTALNGITCRHVDITNLRCKCAHACEDLEVLTKHLTEKHEIKFQNGGHFLIPYKLEDGYQCVNCKKDFDTFDSLTTHMNSHSINNVCEICGSVYFSHEYLREHIKTKHRESTCKKCFCKFPTPAKLAQHNRKEHRKVKNRKTPGMSDTKVSCDICGKDLKNNLNLRKHKQHVHETEKKKFQCRICDLTFFTNLGRSRHETNHLGSSFGCDGCQTKFKSKNSLCRHIKKQHHV